VGICKVPDAAGQKSARSVSFLQDVKKSV